MEEYIVEVGLGLLLIMVMAIWRKLKRHFVESEQLYKWHEPDADGNFPWYKHDDLSLILSKLTECMSNQTELLKAIHNDMKETRKVSEDSRKFQIERAINESKK